MGVSYQKINLYGLNVMKRLLFSHVCLTIAQIAIIKTNAKYMAKVEQHIKCSRKIADNLKN